MVERFGTTKNFETGKIHILSGDTPDRTFCGIEAPWGPRAPDDRARIGQVVAGLQRGLLQLHRQGRYGMMGLSESLRELTE